MKLKLVSKGAQAEDVQVSDATFAREYNESLVHQVIVAYMNGSRAGTKAQKTRAEVRGGGKKPWNQKGTGSARAGSIRSPIWVGGGRAFAAKPRDFSLRLFRGFFSTSHRLIATSNLFAQIAAQECAKISASGSENDNHRPAPNPRQYQGFTLLR